MSWPKKERWNSPNFHCIETGATCIWTDILPMGLRDIYKSGVSTEFPRACAAFSLTLFDKRSLDVFLKVCDFLGKLPTFPGSRAEKVPAFRWRLRRSMVSSRGGMCWLHPKIATWIWLRAKQVSGLLFLVFVPWICKDWDLVAQTAPEHRCISWGSCKKPQGEWQEEPSRRR